MDKPNTRSTRKFQRIVVNTMVWASLSIGVCLYGANVVMHGNRDGYLNDEWAAHAVEQGAPETAGFAVGMGEEIAKIGRGNKALSGHERQEFLSKLAGSAYVDTLYSLFGRPAIAIADLPAGVGARYNELEDKIYINRQSSAEHGEGSAGIIKSVLAHEMAHAWQARQGDLIGEIWAKYNILPPELKAGSYALRNKAEHQAEAVAAAVGYLCVLEQKSIRDRAKIALGKELEKVAPGTLLMTRIFLTHPVYASHPAKQMALAGIDLTPIAPPRPWVEPVAGGAVAKLGQGLAAVAAGSMGSGLREITRWHRGPGQAAKGLADKPEGEAVGNKKSRLL